MPDWDTIHLMIHSVATQSVLDATRAAEAKVPLDDTDIQARVDETFSFIVAEFTEIGARHPNMAETTMTNGPP